MAKKEWSLEEIEKMYTRLRPHIAYNQGRTLLLADPDDNSRLLLTSQLQHKGFDVISAEDSLKALRKIKSLVPDCCIIDSALTPVSGLDIIETISRDDIYGNMLVFLMSSSINKEDKTIARIYGASGILKKPVQPSVFAKTLTELFTKRQS